MNNKHLQPPSYLMLAIIAMLALHFFIPGYRLVVYPWNLLGVLPLLIGGYLNLAADAAFKRHQTTVKPFETSTTLIVSGVFRVTRHPMYLGMVLLLLGIVLLLGSLTPLLVVMVFAVLMELVFIRTEEQMLEQQFRGQWAAYKRRVRKWL